MKRFALLLMIGCWNLALAQAPADETTESPEAAVTPATEPPAEAELTEDELTEDELAEEAAEADPEFEATVEDVFKPGDEISEDYPIPLPADI